MIQLELIRDPMASVRSLADEMLKDFTSWSDVHYPVYVMSRHRATNMKVIPLLEAAEVPYRLVVEPHDRDSYREHHDDALLLSLPQDDQGLWYARQWIRDHAEANGADYHWQIDDNVNGFFVRPRDGKLEKASARNALAYLEAFADRFGNVGGACLGMRVFDWTYVNGDCSAMANRNLTSCILYRSAGDVAARFQPGTAEDTDYALQLLRDGWCTLLTTRVTRSKVRPGSIPGGCWDIDYANDGRRERFVKLARDWPGEFVTLEPGEGRNRSPHVQSSGARIWRKFPQRPAWREPPDG